MLDPRLNKLSLDAHHALLRREADRHGPRLFEQPGSARPPSVVVTVRLAAGDDLATLGRLAELDCSRPLSGPVLIGEMCDRPVAALSLDGGDVIADPFEHSEEIIQLLRLRARQLDPPGAAPSVRRLRRALLPRVWRWRGAAAS
ncbi:MAG: hypothetical protein ACR2HD_05315 [Solirubrobacteraceae bacterium]|nr:MAG: hypothetical protein DLM63_09260 [Solirubrobacterales bacterium]